MPEGDNKQMRVKVLPLNKDEVMNKLYTACRTCYNPGSPIDMWEEVDTIPYEDKVKLIKHVLNSQHMSVLEHVSITVLIEGIDRAVSHQLVRHRMASYSMQSQRYVEFKDGKFDYTVPKTISEHEYTLRLFNAAMDYLTNAYAELVKCGIPAEDARALLPNACCTNLTMTVNIRELIHQCNERLCTCAQASIRAMFKEIAKQVTTELDFLKDYLQPKCVRDGYCSENKRRSCGRMKLRNEVIGGWEK